MDSKNDFTIKRIEDAKAALIMVTAICINAKAHITLDNLNLDDVIAYATEKKMDMWKPTEVMPHYWLRIKTEYGIIMVLSKPAYSRNTIENIHEQ